MKHSFDPLRIRDAVRARLAERLEALGPVLVAAIRRRSPDRTGTLDDSYTFTVDTDTLTLHVGTELLYGRFVEIGTSRRAPFAPIRRTLAEDVETILATLRSG